MNREPLSSDQLDLLHEVAEYVRSHLPKFARAGQRLNDAFSVSAMRSAKARELAGFRSAREQMFDNEHHRMVKTEQPMYDRAFLRHARAGVFYWKRVGPGLGNYESAPFARFMEALKWVSSLERQAVFMDVEDARKVCLLTWLLVDQSAETRLPIVCEFQLLPWRIEEGTPDALLRWFHTRWNAAHDWLEPDWFKHARKAYACVTLNAGSTAQAAPPPTGTDVSLPVLAETVWLRERLPTVRSGLDTLRASVEVEERYVRALFAKHIEEVRETLETWEAAPSHNDAAFLAFAINDAVRRSRQYPSPQPLPVALAEWTLFLTLLVMVEDIGGSVVISALQELPWLTEPGDPTPHYLAWFEQCDGRKLVQMELAHANAFDRLRGDASLARLLACAERAWSVWRFDRVMLARAQALSQPEIQEGPQSSTQVAAPFEAVADVSHKSADEGAEPGKQGVFRRRGDTWEMTLDDEQCPEPHREGFEHLRRLILHADRELTCAQLAGADVPRAKAPPVMDYAAHCRKRMRAIEEHLAGADGEEAERLEAERDALISEVTAAHGLGKRKRKLSDEQEQLRKKVGRTITGALQALLKHHPLLHAHLKRAVRKPSGWTPKYSPDERVVWTLE